MNHIHKETMEDSRKLVIILPILAVSNTNSIDRPAPEPINARNLTHKFSVGNLHPDPQLMKMLRQAAPKISTADSDESGDDEPAMMIKKISATPKWNAFGKIPPLINMPKKVYLSKARHLVSVYHNVLFNNV